MSNTGPDIVQHAQAYLQAGLCVLPAYLQEQRVALESWTQYQKRLPTAEEIRRWFAKGPDALCIVAGAVSSNLEMIDFDVAGELYPPWAELVEERRAGLLERLVRERSQGGGRHLCYRTKDGAARSTKLAQREVECPDKEPVTIVGKQYVPRRRNGRWAALVTLIETRGEGSIFLCAPSAGYVLEQGSLEDLPVLTADGAAGETSLFSVDAPNVVIETVKPAEDGSGDVVVRLYEAKRTATRCTLTTSLPVRAAAQTNMLEDAKGGLTVQNGQIALDLRPFEVKTIRLSL